MPEMEWMGQTLPRAKGGSQLGGGVLWWAESRALRGRPGQWAKLIHPDGWRNQTAASSAAQTIMKGKYAAFKPAGAFEAVSRKVDGEICLFARYVGDG